MTILLRQKPLPQVVRQIVQRDNGAWFDPSDLSTLFQDAAGTIPVTAVEQPVGKMLDKSGNGYHATQSITASRPTLSARYNLLTKTEDFSGAVWGKYGITISPAIGPTGSLDAYTLTEDTSTTSHYIVQSVSTVSSVFNVRIKAAGCDYCVISWRANGDIRYDTVLYNLTTKSRISVQNSSSLYISDSITDAGDGWVDIKIYLKSSTQFIIACANQIKNTLYPTIYAGDGVSGITVWHPTVSSCVLPNTYQRVNTATDYDTDERYFPKYFRFDGIDDYMTLGDVFDVGINGVSMIAAATVRGGEKYPIAGKSISLGTPGRYFLGTNSKLFAYVAQGALESNVAYTPVIGATTVYNMTLSAGSSHRMSLRVNGTVIGDVPTSLPEASNTSLDFMMGQYPVSYGYLNGAIYGLIVTAKALSVGQAAICERYLSRKSGVQL